MAKITVKLNLKGLNELMKSSEIQSVLNEAAGKIAGIAGDGYAVQPAKKLNWIALADVHATTYKARKDNLENNTLLKAAGGVKV